MSDFLEVLGQKRANTADAVTPMPGLVVPFLVFTSVSLVLAVVVAWLLTRHIRNVERDYPSARGEA